MFARLASRGRWQMAAHLTMLDRALTEIAAGRLKRLIVEMPPRHGKSELLGRYLPPWWLGTYPNHRVLYASYEARQARHYGRLARDVFDEWGPVVFGLCVGTGSAAADMWSVAGCEGGMFTAGAGGPLTGKGADLLIVDDPVKNAEQALSETYRRRTWDWFQSTALTRLEPGGAAIVNMTRWHHDDLVGRLKQEETAHRWRTLHFPAICIAPDELGRQPGDALWPQRFPLHDCIDEHGALRLGLESIRAEKPTSWWQALYQQQPSRHETLLWPREYFEGEDLWFDRWPDDVRLRVMTLDPSRGHGHRHADYSAYILLAVQAGGLLWVEADLSNERGVSELVEDGVRRFARFRPHAFRIESNAWQDLLAPLFREAFASAGLLHARPGEIRNHIKKELRIESLDGLLRERQFRFRRTRGTRMLVEQLREFPVALHDDGPDALEMAVRTAQELWDGRDGEFVSGRTG